MHPVFYDTYLQAQLGSAPPLPPELLLLDDATAGEYEVEDSFGLYIGHSGTEYLVK